MTKKSQVYQMMDNMMETIMEENEEAVYSQ